MEMGFRILLNPSRIFHQFSAYKHPDIPAIRVLLAFKNAKDRELKNVEFKEGSAENIPLDDNSVDITIAVTAVPNNPESIKRFASEAERITRGNGYIASVGTAPKWYGGELASVILGKTRRLGPVEIDQLLNLGFKTRDYYTVTDYKTVDRAVETYGFIFGRKAINYLREHNKTTIKWKFRIYYKKV